MFLQQYEYTQKIHCISSKLLRVLRENTHSSQYLPSKNTGQLNKVNIIEIYESMYVGRQHVAIVFITRHLCQTPEPSGLVRWTGCGAGAQWTSACTAVGVAAAVCRPGPGTQTTYPGVRTVEDECYDQHRDKRVVMK